MNWVPLALFGLVLLVAFLGWAFVRIRKRTADAVAGLAGVNEKEIPSLAEECIRICREKLGTALDLRDVENSAQALDNLLDPQQRTRTKTAFQTPDHPGRFVLPLGAFIGELVRTNNPGARWIGRKGGGLAMEIPHTSGTLTMHPFDKVLKHSAIGKGGELLAYVNVAAGKAPLP